MPDTQSGDRATIELPEPQPRDDFHARLQAIKDFFEAHPSLPAPQFTANVYVNSRAELDAFAGYFGQQAPPDAGCYEGAQFYVPVDELNSITVSFHASMARR